MKKEIFGILVLAAIFAFAIVSFLSVPANAYAQELTKHVTFYSSNDVALTGDCPLASGSESTCPMANDDLNHDCPMENGDLDECPALRGGNCPMADDGFGEACPMRNNHVAGGCQG